MHFFTKHDCLWPWIGRSSLLPCRSFGALPRDVACAIIGSRLDYCNSLYYTACQTIFKGYWEKVQNAAARIVCQASRRQLTSLSVAESTTRLPYSVIKPSNCNNRRILLVYSRHINSRVFWGHLRQTYCQHSLHRQTLLLVGSHAAPHRLEQYSLYL